MTFADLGLGDAVLKALSDVGYETPSAIQAATIPSLLAGRDVVGLAQTGTGKTAAFALPILDRLDVSQKTPQALVLAPTRELALQVCEAFEKYAVAREGRARAARVRRSGLRGAALGAATRRARHRRNARAHHGSPRQGHARPVGAEVPRARRSRRDAEDGFRRRRRDHPRRHPRHQAGRPLLGDDAGSDPTHVAAVPARPRRDHGQDEDDHLGHDHPALPDRVVPAEDRRPHAHPRSRRTSRA